MKSNAKERRAKRDAKLVEFAVAAMQGLLAYHGSNYGSKHIAFEAVAHAEVLMSKLEEQMDEV